MACARSTFIILKQVILQVALIFSPRSIAVVGASDNASKIGGVPVDFQRRLGFSGSLYPVNPNAATIQGLKAYPDLRSIGQPVDLAIIAVPAALVEACLMDAIAAKVGSIVLFSSGYAEIGPQGAGNQNRLAGLARQAGIALLGPNCLGFMNIHQSVYATFSPAPGVGLVKPGSIGLVSQSGAFGAYAYALARERGLGMSYWITTGNEAGIDLSECIEWLTADENTRVIMVYMEGCRDGHRLRRALAAAHATRKPVVIVKVGRSAIGAEAAASHTAALAGNDAVYDAVFREYGVYRAGDINEFFDIAASASISRLPPDRSLGLLTVSGGVGVLMADAASDRQLDLRPMPPALQEEIRAWVPFASATNPVDITGQITNDAALLEKTARLMLRGGRYSSWLCFMAAAGASEKFWPVIDSMVTTLRRDFPQAVLAVSTLLNPARRQQLEAMGCLVHVEPADSVRAIAALASFAESFRKTLTPSTAVAKNTVLLKPGTWTEPEGLALLKSAGINTIACEVVDSPEDAIRAAARFATPVALKIVSRDITHKSEIGGVALNVAKDDVTASYHKLLQNAADNAPDALVTGVLVAPMLSGGVECLLGAHFDPVFGPVVMFGLGGLFVEVMDDVALHTAPVTPLQALQMIHSIKALPLLNGARGKPPVDLDFLAANLAALSELAANAGDSLQSIDINPFVALPKSQGSGFAVDAVVIGRARAPAHSTKGTA